MDELYLFTILLFVIAMIVGFGIGVAYSYFRAFKILEQELLNLDESSDDADAGLKVRIMDKNNTDQQYLVDGVELAHEIVEGIHLFYLKSSDGSREFVCQGSSFEDAAEAYQLSSLKSYVAIFINSVNNKQCAFMNGQYYE